MDAFGYASGRQFWPGSYTVETVKDKGERSLLVTTGKGIRVGEVDWSLPQPSGRFITSEYELKQWLD